MILFSPFLIAISNEYLSNLIPTNTRYFITSNLSNYTAVNIDAELYTLFLLGVLYHTYFTKSISAYFAAYTKISGV